MALQTQLGIAAARAIGGNLAGNQVATLCCLGALVVNHSVFRLGAMPWLWTAAVVLAVALVAILAPDLRLRAVRAGPLRTTNAAIGLLVLTPLLASLALGWQREFSFSGDQSFHIKQTYYMAYWWASWPGSPPVGIVGPTLGLESFRGLLNKPWQLLWSRFAIVAALVVIIWRAYRWRPILGVLFALIVVLAWGLCERTIYLRYPGGGYFLAMPFVVPAYGFGNVELAGRLPNVAAAFAWLFVLRPYLVGRWPDLQILPAAALVLWHKDVLHYFDSAYLEPWPVVLSLLAVEALIVRGREAAPVACLLVGFAAAVKEPFILALPFVWMAGMVPLGSIQDAARTSGAALAAAFPFLAYYAAGRTIDPTDLPRRPLDLLQSYGGLLRYGQEFGHQLAIAFPGASAVLAIGAAVGIPFAIWRSRHKRILLLCLLGAGIAILLFFALERFSQPWAGYFRFLLPALPFFAAGLIACGYLLPVRTLAVVGLSALALHGHSAFTAVARSAGPATDRNFVEHYDAPISFPLKSLIAEAQRKNLISRDVTLAANQPDDFVRPVPGINVAFGPLGRLDCECGADRPNVMVIFVRYANLAASFADRPPAPGQHYGPPRERDRIWRQNRAARPQCLARLRQTCRHVIERIEGGEVVGALAVR